MALKHEPKMGRGRNVAKGKPSDAKRVTPQAWRVASRGSGAPGHPSAQAFRLDLLWLFLVSRQERAFLIALCIAFPLRCNVSALLFGIPFRASPNILIISIPRVKTPG